MKNKLLLAIALSATVAISIIGQGTSHVAAQSTGDIPAQLEMVTSADYPPYEFRDTAEGNKIIGFDIDIANAIAEELGFELTVTDTDFNGIIPALQSGRADFAMAGMTPTEERKQNVDFSEVYYEAKNTIVANKGSNLTEPADLSGKTVGVQLGATQAEAADDIAKEYSDITVKPLNKTSEIIQEVKAGRIDAAIIEDTIARGFISSNPDLEFNTIPNTGEAGSAIARALAMEPEVMLFDEPTSALDPETVKEVLEAMQALVQTGITMAVVTHEMGFAREVANRILFLDGGRLAEDSPPSKFFTNPECARAQQFLEKML